MGWFKSKPDPWQELHDRVKESHDKMVEQNKKDKKDKADRDTEESTP